LTAVRCFITVINRLKTTVRHLCPPEDAVATDDVTDDGVVDVREHGGAGSERDVINDDNDIVTMGWIRR